MRNEMTVQVRIAVLIFLMAFAPRVAAAQNSLGDVLSFLLTNQSVPTGDPAKDVEAARTTRDTLTRHLLVELATVPPSPSSGGFSYRFNPRLGMVERATASFGSFFTERSLTAGGGQASIGVNLRLARYRSLDGHDLRDGTFVTTGNQFRDETQPFDIETLTLDLESRILTFTGSLGITDRLEVGLAVPFVSLSLTGNRASTYRGERLIQATADASSSGLGDVAARAKYDLIAGHGAGLALAGEVRLPTGRAEDLLGAGETEGSGLVIVSIERGVIVANANFSIASGGLSDGIGYRGAVCVNASPQVTIVGELLGRRLTNAGRVVAVRAPHPTIAGVDTMRLLTEDDSSMSLAGLAGLKWNPTGTWLVNAHLLVPMTDRGLRSGFVTIIGLEYAFGL